MARSSLDFTQMLGNIGPKYKLVRKGQTYIFSFLTDKQRAWYEQWMKQSILEEIENNEYISEERKQKQIDMVMSKIRGGEYKFGGTEFNRVRNTEVGKVRFIQMLLYEHHPKISYEEVENLVEAEPERISVIFALVMVESSIITQRITKEEGDALLQDIYRQLVLPPEAGGAGMSLDIIAELTDRQKEALFIKPDLKDTRQKTFAPEVQKEQDRIMEDILTRYKEGEKMGEEVLF